MKKTGPDHTPESPIPFRHGSNGELSPRDTFRAHGPRTRRELLAFLRARGGRPG